MLFENKNSAVTQIMRLSKYGILIDDLIKELRDSNYISLKTYDLQFLLESIKDLKEHLQMKKNPLS